jgi:hypothetical protein
LSNRIRWHHFFVLTMAFHPQTSLHPHFFLVHLYKQNIIYLCPMIEFDRHLKWTTIWTLSVIIYAELKTTKKKNELPMVWPALHSIEDSVRSNFDKGGKRYMAFTRTVQNLLWHIFFWNYLACMEFSYRICTLGMKWHHQGK